MQQQKTFQKESLFNAIKANDEGALKTLYRKNYKIIENYVRNNSGTADHAKDVYQEAFIAVWRNIQLEKFVPENDNSLDKYLFRVAKNKWMDHLRSNHFRKSCDLGDWHQNIEDQALTEADARSLNEVKSKFRLLGSDCQRLLSSFYFRKESMKEIAERFNWTPATARNNKYRCLKRLREMINK